MLKVIQKISQDTRGISMLIALGLTMLLTLLGAGAMQIMAVLIKSSGQVERANIAYFAAEAGVELALYDLADYEQGYQTDLDTVACGAAVDLSSIPETSFGESCNDANPYRLADFTDSALSNGRAFYRLFSRLMPDQTAGDLLIPNPYFVGDRDGVLEIDNDSLDTTAAHPAENEFGILNKFRPISLPLLVDIDPRQSAPVDRYLALDPSTTNARLLVMFDPNETVPDFSAGDSSSEDLLLWTLSAIDGFGEEYTLQGVVREDDFSSFDCDGDGSADNCFEFDLTDSTSLAGEALAGEDINKNIDIDLISIPTLNRLSGITEEFHYNRPQEFFDHLQTSWSGPADTQWQSGRFSVSLVGTPSEMSDIASDRLIFRFVADDTGDAIADDYTYIVSEGFSGTVKQTIETRFRQQSTIAVFSYAIFQ